MISISEMASKQKTLNYDDLRRELEINDRRELEDLIIDCIYNDLIKGKLD